MKLRKLIENQTIRVDNHHRGDGCPLNWDSKKGDIHIHKIVHRSGTDYTFKIPLNVQHPLTSADFERMPHHIRKEIEEAFQDAALRQDFVKTLYDILKDYESIVSDKEKAFNALMRVCDYFDLKNGTRRDIEVDLKYIIDFSEHDASYFAEMTKDAISVGQKKR
ncbi:MAG: hypothetical protein K6E73_07685 [Bacteroidales bacterium]|nr:hypothetical protein [Bacteroidales bacterium]